MTDIKALLDACPHMAGYRVEQLTPEISTAVYPLGITASGADILGRRWLKKAYKLCRRDTRGSAWTRDMTAWALGKGLEVRGGELGAPAGDRTGVYTLTVSIKIWEEQNEN